MKVEDLYKHLKNQEGEFYIRVNDFRYEYTTIYQVDGDKLIIEGGVGYIHKCPQLIKYIQNIPQDLDVLLLVDGRYFQIDSVFSDKVNMVELIADGNA